MTSEILRPLSSMNCDRIAAAYQSLEYASFGKQLERRRFAYLRETANSQSALICGGGDGRFLARLLHFNHRVQVDFVDLSPKMIQIADNRVSGMGHRFRRRVRFYPGDIRFFQPQSNGYDLIVTHFFLDCFSDAEMEPVVSSLAALARPEAQWLLSEFSEVEGFIGRFWTVPIIRALYAGFHLATGLRAIRLPNFKPQLQAHGFRCQLEQKALGGLLCSSLWRSKIRFQGS
jgi:ubiquinone/menaquinone biosynthesis C-methylase UbiE